MWFFVRDLDRRILEVEVKGFEPEVLIDGERGRKSI